MNKIPAKIWATGLPCSIDCISVSVSRDKQLIYSIGRSAPIGEVKGQIGIAGTIIFGKKDKPDWGDEHKDLAPFEVTIYLDSLDHIILYGIEIVGEDMPLKRSEIKPGIQYTWICRSVRLSEGLQEKLTGNWCRHFQHV